MASDASVVDSFEASLPDGVFGTAMCGKHYLGGSPFLGAGTPFWRIQQETFVFFPGMFSEWAIRIASVKATLTFGSYFGPKDPDTKAEQSGHFRSSRLGPSLFSGTKQRNRHSRHQTSG